MCYSGCLSVCGGEDVWSRLTPKLCAYEAFETILCKQVEVGVPNRARALLM